MIKIFFPCLLILSLGTVALLLACTATVCAQLTRPSLPDSLFSSYYHQRVAHFNQLAHSKDDIIFIGNSLTDGGEWSELFQNRNVKNRGISGDHTAGLINRIDEIARSKPSKVFLLVGINDLARGLAADSVLRNILWIADYLKQETPVTKLYVQSILPVNAAFGKFTNHTNKASAILHINTQLQRKATEHHYTFLDLYPAFVDKKGRLKKEYTNDGLHLLGEGYLAWKHLLYPYVYDVQQL